MKYLVIVESPSKCKKIAGFLNDNDDLNIYEVVATMGHITELNSLENVDINNNFYCKYDIIQSKKKNIDLIKKKIKVTDEVILACDADREGEGICDSICKVFNLDLHKTKRITFNEITETAILNAIKTPNLVDTDLVHAQHTRQILDLLVGFKVSPILWKYIKNNKEQPLSAGRCQSSALKIIYENQKEINESIERKTYNTIGYFTNYNLKFELNKQYDTEEEMKHFLNGCIGYNHIYTCSQPIKVLKKQPEPFTTSKIQQAASNEFRYSPKETMKICQTLYEKGYITYMRTDNTKYSEEFINSAKDYITRKYEAKYVNETIEHMKNAKDNPHEAIRPTNISLFELPEDIGSKEKKMYKLIWLNTLESCMAQASFYSVTASISSFQNTKFSFTSELIDFPGWKIVTQKYSVDNKDYQYLQTIKQNGIIPYKKILSNVTIKGSKQHYTEARLVAILEEKGIGRPSTFSTIIDKIQEREYVKKEDVPGKEITCTDFELKSGNIVEIETKREFGNEKGKLVIQQLGIIVMEFLEKHFSELFNYNYTKTMEDELDKISNGETLWFDLCKNCNTKIETLIDELNEKSIEKNVKIKIDDNNTYMIGKYGPVIKCVEQLDGKEEITFKTVNNDIDIHKIEKGEYAIDEIINTNKKASSRFILGKHEGNDVILKKGKYGMYISWGEKSRTLKELGNRPIENIKFEEIQKYLDEGSNIVREISKHMSIRRGPRGDYLFYKTSKMKKPQFFDITQIQNDLKENYKICDINILKSWINDKYEIAS